MATLNPQAPGAVLTFSAASGGGDVANFAGVANPRIIIVNASGSSITVTLTGVVNCSQGFTHNQVVTCPVGDTEISPASNVISQTAGTVGQVAIGYSSATSITVAATS